MKVSVITVCFNSGKTIAETIRSVAEQSWKEIEHIVVDGGSVDGTQSVVAATPGRVARFVSEPDRGIYDAMNKGLLLATGDIVGFLNSDDVYASEDTVADIVKAFEATGAEACYGDIVFVSNQNTDAVVRYWRAGDYSPERLHSGWMPPHPTFYVRREVYAKHGGFNLDYRLQSDFDMAVRLLSGGHVRLHYIPRILVRMRMGGASNASIGNVLRGNLEAYRSAKQHGLPVGPFFPVRKILSRLPQFFSRPMSQRGQE